MTDLVAFIRARLDEDEGIARIITPGGYAPQEWRDVTPTNGAGWHEIRAFDRTNIEPPGAEQDEGGPPVALVEGGRGEHVHIARHDPARVLREVEAHRELLDYCASELRDDATSEIHAALLAHLAAVWSDHPDYRAEWAPTRD